MFSHFLDKVDAITQEPNILRTKLWCIVVVNDYSVII